MKEIIYVQAGSYANHIGTHFWNTQESYLNALGHTSLEEASSDISEIDPQVAFRQSEQQIETLTPRAVIFDHKEEFGNTASVLAQSADLDYEDVTNTTALWAGQTAEIRQPSVGRSGYHDQLDDVEHEPASHASATITGADAHRLGAASSRYWTDFSRVYFAPKSLQRVPDVPSWDIASHDWNAGSELYSRYDADNHVMEEAVRTFVEECDLLQGLQLMHDTATFGSFIDSFLAAFREEYPRLTVLSLPILSAPHAPEIDDARGLRRVINDAMVLRNLNEVSSMNVPLFVPNEETNAAAIHSMYDSDVKRPYYTSALVSPHIESATLPTRLQSGAIDLSDICAQLDWRGGTRFAHLGGTFPTQEDIFSHDIELDLSSPSALPSTRNGGLFARLDITRGLSSRGIASYDDFAAHLSIREPSLRSVHLRPYPLPSSFPMLANHLRSSATATAMHSSLFTTGRTAGLFKSYARLAEDAVRRNADMGSMERDEVRELAADLWTIHEAFLDEEETNDAELELDQ